MSPYSHILPQSDTRSAPRRATLIVITALSVLTLNLFLPSLPSMATEFGVSYGVISWAIAGYLLLSSVLGLVLGPVSDKLGRRPVLLMSFGLFTFASVGAALAQSFELFLIFRLLQAVVITGSTLSRAIVRDIYPPGKGTSVLGYIAMAMSVAPMIGPMLGGMLEETLGWRAVFWSFAGVGAASFVLLWADLGETATGRALPLSAHVKGYGTVLRASSFWAYTLVIGFSVSAFFVFLAGAPIVADQVFHLPPSRAGLAMGSTAAGFFIGSFIAGRMAERADLGALMVWGRVIGLIGPVLALLLVQAGQDHPILIFGLMCGLGLGNGISLPSANTGVMSLRPDLAGSASGLSMAIATAMGAGASAITGAVMSWGPSVAHFCALLAAACLGALICAIWARRSGPVV